MARTRRSFALLVLLAACAEEIDPRTQAVTPEGIVVPHVSVTQLASLRWLEGTWRTDPTDSIQYVQRYWFADDSTLLVETYADTSRRGASDTTAYALRDGWFGTHTGDQRWAASQIAPKSASFVPLANTQQTFAWEYKSRDLWVGRIVTPAGGTSPARDDFFQMHRLVVHDGGQSAVPPGATAPGRRDHPSSQKPRD